VDIAEYKNEVPYGESHTGEAFSYGGFDLLPNYVRDANGNLVFSHYTASKDGYIAFIIAANQLGSFEFNISTCQTAFDFYYSSGQPGKGQIAMAAGEYWAGLGMMWHDAVRSPEWWAGAIGALRSLTAIPLETPGAVNQNFKRFMSKIPANSNVNASLTLLRDGNYLMEANSAGKVPGSIALYQKWVNPQGVTIKMFKTTIDPQGNVVHVKSKL